MKYVDCQKHYVIGVLIFNKFDKLCSGCNEIDSANDSAVPEVGKTFNKLYIDRQREIYIFDTFFMRKYLSKNMP